MAEVNLVLSCVHRNSVLQLSDLVQAGELMYIGKKRDEILSKIIDDYQRKNNFPSFVEDCLIPTMYLLKRHQNLDDFMEALSFKLSQIFGSAVFSLPKISLKMLVHVLLLKCDLSTSRMTMSLLSKRNPVPLVAATIDPQQQQQSQYQIVPHIIHVWNYNLPTLLSFGIGPCFGKSTLLNALFMSTFEQSRESVYFQETIDIDFGFSFLPSRLTNIADAHGAITKELLYKIQDLFAGFIMHVQYGYLEKNVDEVSALVDALSTRKFRLLIIRDLEPHLNETCSDLLMTRFSNTMPQTFMLPHIADQNNTQNKHLIRTLRDLIISTARATLSHDEDYLRSELRRLINHQYKQHLSTMYDVIVPLERKLFQLARDEDKVIEYFPEYSIFVKSCQLQQKLSKMNFYGEDDATIHEVRQQIAECKQKKGQAGGGIIFDLFYQILTTPTMLMCLNLLSNELKEHRNHVVSTGEMANQLPIQKNLSLELLWRNAIICSVYQEPEVRSIIVQRYYEYTDAGFPFEIIDGDNFYFPYSFLTDVLSNFRNQRILVISVIGPQNSGKSTLLNYMFGTFFDVRDGRCTRGIYGSFVKSNLPEFDYIMLIDTEGLLGVEREDKEFDRRLVLFCLAVSHLVIVNMIGEVNETLKTMLTLCADSLKQMGVSRVPQPTVHFVLNQKADLNISNNQAAIDKIIADLKSFDLSGMIDIKPNTFHTLPNAFKKERGPLNDTSLPCLIKTEPDFIELVQLLSGKIITSAMESLTRSSEQFTDPSHWLKSSSTIFDTLQKFADLTYYRDINERRQDNEVKEYIRTKLVQEFSSQYHDLMTSQSANKNEREIEELLLPEMEKKQKILSDEMENHLKLLKTSDTIRTRTRQFLRVQIIEMFNALKTSCKMVGERSQIQLLVQNGEGDLKKLIEDIIGRGEIMSEQTASENFDNMFNTIINNINKSFDAAERVKTALKHIYTSYNIYEKDCLPDYQHHILNNLSWLQQVSSKETKVEEKLILEDLHTRFTTLTYRYSLVQSHPFVPDTMNLYSMTIIENTVYLNKLTLQQDFQNFSTPRRPHHNQQKSLHRRVLGALTAPLRWNNKEYQNALDDERMNQDFLFEIRKKIIRDAENSGYRQSADQEQYIILQGSTLTHAVIRAITEATRGSTPGETRQIQTDLIQKIVGVINTLIKDINLELNPFGLSLSKQLKSTFHTCAIVLLTKYYYNEQQNHFLQTLSTLSDRKKDLQTYFISMVVPNTSADITSGISLCKQVKEFSLKSLLDDGQKLINFELRQYDCLNRKWIQDRCDGKLLTADSQWYLDYIENPTKIIEEFYNETWKNIQASIDQNLMQLKANYDDAIQNFFYCIRGIQDTLKHAGRAAKFVDDIFQPVEHNGLNANQNFNNKRRCMAILLLNYFSGQQFPEIYTCYNNKYHLTNEAQHTFDLLAQRYKPSEKLSTITKAMTTVYDSCSVDNLSAFLQCILDEKLIIMEEFDNFSCDFNHIDTQDTYARLRDKIRGCPDRCPCCRRPCDADHTQVKSNPGSEDNIHRCETGHALRAMNGYKFEKSDEASLFMCEQITDDQTIIVGRQQHKWSQFKLLHPDWIFESLLSDEELTRLHEKFLIIWSKIGVDLCLKYDMKFVTFNSHKTNTGGPLHFILLLDGSGSMNGSPWSHLVAAVREFIQRRRDLHTKDRITIISFSDCAKIEYFDEEVNNINVNSLTCHGGGTSFSAAFAQANECITRSRRIDTNYAIIFMSDGEATYPAYEINTLLRLHQQVIKKFWTLALGHASMSVLNQINQQMNGAFFDVEESSRLVEAYAEIARTS